MSRRSEVGPIRPGPLRRVSVARRESPRPPMSRRGWLARSVERADALAQAGTRAERFLAASSVPVILHADG